MVHLLVMKNPVQGVCSVEFIGRCHINADIGSIPTQSGPDFPVTLAEGDGRTPNFSPQEMGPAQRSVSHLDGAYRPVAQGPVLSKGIFPRRNMLPEDGGQTILVGCPVSRASVAGFAITRQRGIECRFSLMAKTYGMDEYVQACHVHSRFPQLRRLSPQPSASA
jgi:hypothetical protein